MKAKRLILTLTIIPFLVLNSFSQEFTCKLKGSLVGRTNNEVKLLPVTIERDMPGTIIPINNNCFEYDLKISQIEQYQLIFGDQQEGVHVIKFFPDSDVVEFTLFKTDEFDKNIIKGGELNDKQMAYERLFACKCLPFFNKLTVLIHENNYYSHNFQKLDSLAYQAKKMGNESEYRKLRSKRDSLKSEEKFTHPAILTQNKLDSLYQKKEEWELNYIKMNQDIFSYALLLSRLYDQMDTLFTQSIYPLFSNRFPSHPYTKLIGEKLNAIKTIRIGGQFVDFFAPTLDGRIVKLSEEIKGKVALIDLWSPWCGPCRTGSKRMIPIYEKYKDKGFTIVGVASVYKKTDSVKDAIEKDKYPWLNLLEFNDKNGIWNKYNISGAGGATFLVDSTGKIIEMYPNAQQVDTILSELFK